MAGFETGADGVGAIIVLSAAQCSKSLRPGLKVIDSPNHFPRMMESPLWTACTSFLMSMASELMALMIRKEVLKIF